MRRLREGERQGILAGAVIVAGIVFRLRQYVYDRSLWVDESFLAYNLIQRSFAGLTRPLAHNQGAPLGFLWVEKLVVEQIGSGERSLRLLPFLAGTLALLGFYLVTRRLLEPAVGLAALFLLAVSRTLIFYSNETNQYSLDVLAVVVCLGMFAYVRNHRPGWSGWLSVGLIGAVLVLFSHPAIFSLVALGLVVFWPAWKTRDRGRLAGIAAAATLWLITFGLTLWISLRALVSNDKLTTYWESGFMPPLKEFPAQFGWLGLKSLEALSFPLSLELAGLAAFLCLLGIFVVYRRDPALLEMVLLPAGLAVVASAAQQYPLEDRLLLFVAPYAALLAAEGLVWLFRLLQRTLPPTNWVLVALLLLPPALVALSQIGKPYEREEIRPVLERLREEQQPGDFLYLYNAADYPFRYYGPRLGLTRLEYTVGIDSRDDWQLYYDELDALMRDHDRVWLVFSHVYKDGGANEEKLFLSYLDRAGFQPLQKFKDTGAAAYLFDFKP